MSPIHLSSRVLESGKHLLLAALVSLALPCSASGAMDFEVSPVPLTSKEQLSKGIAGGEGFQQVMSIAYSPSNPATVYIGVDTSQVWKSTDSGKTWTTAGTGHYSIGSRSLFVLPTDADTVFSAGTLGANSERVGQNQPLQGIYRSTDGGEGWQLVHETDFFKQQSNSPLFAVDSRTLGGPYFTIYAGTYRDGLLVSRDSGATWSDTGFKAGEILQLTERPANPGTFWIASSQGLSIFDGTSAVAAGAGLPTWPRSIAASPEQPDILYAALGDKGMYKSSDGGKTFKALTAASTTFGSINNIAVSPVDADVAVFTSSGRNRGPFFTKDGGATWSRSKPVAGDSFTTGGGFFLPSPIALHPTNASFALTSSNGRARILRSEDGGATFTFSGSGYLGARLRTSIFQSADDMVFNLTDHGPWRTGDNGQTFAPIEVPRMGGRSVGGADLQGDTFILGVGSWKHKHLIISRDLGKSWSSTGKEGRLPLVRFNDKKPDMVYAGPYRSADKGITWKALDQEIFAVDPNDSDRVYALAGGDKSTQIMVSQDAGDTWQAVGPPLEVRARTINHLEVDPFKQQRFYVAAASGLWLLDDGRWQRRAGRDGMSADSFGSSFVESVVAHPGQTGLIFAGRRSPNKGMGNGLFYSTNHGDSWQQFPDTLLANTNIWSISINPYSGHVFAGTAHGIYRITFQTH